LTLDKHTLDEAQKTAKLADSQQTLDDTKVQLDADEKFFADTKEGCQTKASEWSERSRLRTEELQSIKKAIAILSSPEAQRTFYNSSTTFLQLAVVSRHSAGNPNKAYNRLKTLAVKYRSTSLAELAVQAKAGGHFDKVMASIDAMIEFLRKEEQADIAHRDRCQGSQLKNKNDKEDLQSTIEKTDKEISRMNDEAKELKTKIATLTGVLPQLLVNFVIVQTVATAQPAESCSGSHLIQQFPDLHEASGSLLLLQTGIGVVAQQGISSDVAVPDLLEASGRMSSL